MKTHYLVVDTAALVKHVPLWEYAETLYSVPEIITEIRDKEARRRLEALPFPIIMRQPQPQSIKFVNEFSKKTGDYASLSLADIKILALTYELEVEVHESATHLNTEPHKIITEQATKRDRHTKQQQQQQQQQEEEQEDEEVKEGMENLVLDDNSQTDTISTQSRNTQVTEEDGCIKTEESEESIEGRQSDGENESEDDEESKENDEEDDDDDGWITCENIKKHRGRRNVFGDVREEEEEKDVKVACITADFAIQNVSKHIGLSVMGVDGKIIKHLKTYILRCHACFKTTSVMDKIFCPHCGNKTLKKVSVTLDPDGTQRIWINTKRPINKRGSKFSLPTPKGGKHGRNPILVSDQREAKKFSSKMSRKKINPLHEDYNPDQTPFAVRDVYSRAAQLGYIGGKNHNHFYWEKRNPNEPQRRTGKK